MRKLFTIFYIYNFRWKNVAQNLAWGKFIKKKSGLFFIVFRTHFPKSPKVNKQLNTTNLKIWLVDITYSQVRQNEELWVVCLLLFKKYENDKPIREH